ncbi:MULTISPECIES: hypothetical protein [unclassified Mucilaginibacter]|uniref:hypothetical protein n=1 Tax=unclassified Mucilaginibacter TaxID=2617802 RepID=UPI00138C2FED|nr:MULTISPECIES: hypothetical protein [unclassified Mucilaginibacter]MBB5397080.1 azurin [Mucilaginibacter sp. AK015]QHS54707.1 hypothetical protein GWR56_03785 [Mucilaginibacter sp. 14171R-50]
MKKLKHAFILTMLIAVTAVSCKKDDDVKASTGSVTVTAANYGFDGVNGSNFKSTKAAIVQVGNLWTLTAIRDGGNESITIVLGNVTAAGTFDLDEDNTDGNGAVLLKDYTKTADPLLNYSTGYSATGGMKGGGQVKITKLTDTEAEGEFYIVAHTQAGKEAFVEQGKFTGKVTKQ